MTIKFSVMAMWVGTVLLLGGCVGGPPKPPPPPRPARLVGSVHGATYTSAEGGFSVPFPVSPEVNGRVSIDDSHEATFVDNWGSRITFKEETILENSSMRSMLETQGHEKALTEFAKRQYGDLITVHYHPEEREGMISFIYLRPASPTTAVAVFVQGRQLFLVENDMLPGVQLLAQSDDASRVEREKWLESVAVKLAQSIQVK